MQIELASDANLSIVGFNLNLLKICLRPFLGIPHSSEDWLNLLPRLARMSLEWDRGVQMGIIVIPNSNSRNFIFTISSWILGFLEPLDRNEKLFFESVCQHMIEELNLVFVSFQSFMNFSVANSSLCCLNLSNSKSWTLMKLPL